MITVELLNFRKYDKKKIEIIQGTNLFDGPSGSGKSTIFESIYWCLYGKLRNIQGKKQKSKTQVTLTIGEEFGVGQCESPTIIFRQRNPKLFKVTHNDCEYMDENADKLIEELFGSKEMWKITSYLSQNSRNEFLTTSSKIKLNMLNEVIFGSQEIESTLNKIDDEIKNTKTEIKVSQGEIDSMKKLLNTKNIEKMYRYTKDEIDGMCENNETEVIEKKLNKYLKCIDKYKTKIGTLRGQIKTNNKNMVTFKVLKEKKEKLEKKIDKDEIQKIKIEDFLKTAIPLNVLRTRKKLLPIEQKILISKKELGVSSIDEVWDYLESLPISFNLSKSESIDEKILEIESISTKVQKQCWNFEKNFKLSQDLNIEYEMNIINEEKTLVKSQIQTSKEIEMKKIEIEKKKNLEKKLNNIEKNIKNESISTYYGHCT